MMEQQTHSPFSDAKRLAALRNALSEREIYWERLQAMAEFQLLAALDRAVAVAGGQSILQPAPGGFVQESLPQDMSEYLRVRGEMPKTHGNFAYAALEQASEPLSLEDIIGASIKAGATIRGDAPINFRAALYRDERFRRIKIERYIYWWLSDKPLPKDWPK